MYDTHYYEHQVMGLRTVISYIHTYIHILYNELIYLSQINRLRLQLMGG